LLGKLQTAGVGKHAPDASREKKEIGPQLAQNDLAGAKARAARRNRNANHQATVTAIKTQMIVTPISIGGTSPYIIMYKNRFGFMVTFRYFST